MLATLTTETAAITLSTTATATSCPNCGTNLSATLLADARLNIANLEAQVRLLNGKASAAVDRWADYEDELAELRDQLNRQAAEKSALRVHDAGVTPPPTARFSPDGFGLGNRISHLLSPRKPTASLKAPEHTLDAPASPVADVDSSLRAALSREQELRRAAEMRLDATSREVEELSVSLFEQANEMVATERRERARLESRLGELEKRDQDKRRRLERLESALGRIEKARGLLKEAADGKGLAARPASTGGGGGGEQIGFVGLRSWMRRSA